MLIRIMNFYGGRGNAAALFFSPAQDFGQRAPGYFRLFDLSGIPVQFHP